MNKLTENLLSVIQAHFPEYSHHDLYTLLYDHPQVVLDASRHLGQGYLTRTSRARSNARQRFRKSGWKLVKFFANKKPADLYSVVIELGAMELVRSRTSKVAKELVAHFAAKGGSYYYTVEKCRWGKVHVHMLLHLPKWKHIPQKLKDAAGTQYSVKHETFNSRYPGRSPLEGVTRFVRYLYKPRDARHLSSVTLKEAAFLDELHEYLSCERERVPLSGSKVNTRSLGDEDKQKFLDYYDELFDKRAVTPSAETQVA